MLEVGYAKGKDLCISILEFKYGCECLVYCGNNNLCISILEFKYS